jgi:hypothetical protein
MAELSGFDEAYFQLSEGGPFSGRVDPWAEAGRYFRQLHAAIISQMQVTLHKPLFALGYFAGRETSFQVVERRQPDINVRQKLVYTPTAPTVRPDHAAFDYRLAAAEAMAEPGVYLADPMPELDALYIREIKPPGNLVTVVEIISPSNKADRNEIAQFSADREKLVRGQKVHMVEIDLTRSVKRMIAGARVDLYPYHIAVHLALESAEGTHGTQFIGLEFGVSLKRFALPLRAEVLAVDTQALYDAAYQQNSLSTQIDLETGYEEAHLPFPSLLSEAERRDALAAVAHWRAELAMLRTQADLPPGA